MAIRRTVTQSITVTGTPVPTEPAPTPTTADQALVALLDRYGLGSLASVLINAAKQGLSQQEAYQELVKSEPYKQRFAGNEQRRQKGFSVLSEAEYLAKEDALRNLMGPNGYDLPRGFYDEPADFAKAIGADIGEGELRRRLDARKALVTDGEMTGALAYARDKYGLSEGDLVAYFIDPDRAAPLLEKIAAAAGIGAAGARTGWGDVGTEEAERLAALGISADQAQRGYSQAASLAELTADIDNASVSRSDLSAALLADDAEARKRVERTQAARKATFAQGGGYASGRSGLTGLGSANS